MFSQDDFDSAVQLQHQTIDFLSKYHLAPTPINYAVIYFCLSKRFKNLTFAVSDKLSEEGQIDAVFLEDMFHEYFGQIDNNQKEFVAPLEQVLIQTLHSINTQVENQNGFLSSLEQADASLQKSTTPQSLQKLVNFLTDEVQQNKQNQQALTSELAKAGNEVKQLQTKLEKLKIEASTDSLTGLLNRRGCQAKLNELDEQSTHSSLVIDIDHFKAINDNFGHSIGDKVLKRVAKEIKLQINTADFAVRFGGEEFLVFLKNKTLNDAQKIAEQIRLAIANLKLVQKQSSVTLPPITVSIGISQRQQQEDWMAMFNRADAALYHAKNSGRNRSVIHGFENGEPAFAEV